MDKEQIEKVENALVITLPPHYVEFISTFDGLSHSEYDIGRFLYSEVDLLIEMNLLIGFHTGKKSVGKKLIIGDNGGGDFYMIDLENQSDQRVFFFDHELENDVTDADCYVTLKRYRDDLMEMFGIENER